MKKIINKSLYCFGLLVLLFALFSGCNNVMTPPAGEVSDAETGRLAISIAEAGERTILPVYPEFSKYEFIFEAKDGQEGQDMITRDAAGTYMVTVNLAPGNWTIIVKGYVYISGIEGIEDGDYRAAEGKEDILVSAGQFESLFIDLYGDVRPGEKGILSWDITLPDDTESTAMMIRTIEGAEVGTVDLMDRTTGEMALDAGYYFITFITNDKEPKSEILHIYGGLTSPINRAMHRAPVFYSISDLADWLDDAEQNEFTFPYDIHLFGLNLETDFFQDDDPLYKLFDALNGKYVNLDLSSCEGSFIPDMAYERVALRPNKDRLMSLVLPIGITSIGSYTFNECVRLTMNELPARLNSIGDFAFLNCVSLALTELPAELTFLGTSAFFYCSRLALTSLPEGLLKIGNRVFYGCTSLALTELPAGLLEIGESAFYNCTSLALTELPAGLTSIGEFAFRGCWDLALTKLPEKLTTIPRGAFSGCSSLALTELPAELTYIEGSTIQHIYDMYDGAFSNCTSLALTELPAGVTYIGPHAFYGCTSLALIELPAELISIGRSAFEGCTSLALTELPTGLTSIPNSAFAGCSSLALTELPAGLTGIGNYAFADCTSLALTELPAGRLTSIGNYAFARCTSLALTELSAGLTSIGVSVFAGCTSLTLMKLPSTLRRIEGELFASCTNLIQVELPVGLTYIGNNAFSDCVNLSTIELPTTLTSIQQNAFSGCTSLELVVCHAITPPSLGFAALNNTHNDLVVRVPAQSVDTYKSNWFVYADRIEPIYFVLSFTGPTEKVISISKTVNNNLSRSEEGSITLGIFESFDRYEWFVGAVKVADENIITLQASDPVFALGLNWITAVIYTGTGASAIPWSGKFLVQVND